MHRVRSRSWRWLAVQSCSSIHSSRLEWAQMDSVQRATMLGVDTLERSMGSFFCSRRHPADQKGKRVALLRITFKDNVLASDMGIVFRSVDDLYRITVWIDSVQFGDPVGPINSYPHNWRRVEGL